MQCGHIYFSAIKQCTSNPHNTTTMDNNKEKDATKNPSKGKQNDNSRFRHQMDDANGGVDVNATAIDAAIAKLVQHTVWQRKMQPQKRGAVALATCNGAI